jgi:hypothetical protein
MTGTTALRPKLMPTGTEPTNGSVPLRHHHPIVDGDAPVVLLLLCGAEPIGGQGDGAPQRGEG